MNYECDVGKLADTPLKMIEKLSKWKIKRGGKNIFFGFPKKVVIFFTLLQINYIIRSNLFVAITISVGQCNGQLEKTYVICKYFCVL